MEAFLVYYFIRIFALLIRISNSHYWSNHRFIVSKLMLSKPNPSEANGLTVFLRMHRKKKQNW